MAYFYVNVVMPEEPKHKLSIAAKKCPLPSPRKIATDLTCDRYFYLAIENAGDETARDVRILFPEDDELPICEYIIKSHGSEEIRGKVAGSKIPLSDIEVMTTVKVFIWVSKTELKDVYVDCSRGGRPIRVIVN